MADSTSTVAQLAPSQSNKELRINELIDALSAAILYGRNAATTTGLVWGYYGGRWGGAPIANGTATLTANATTYIQADRATGVVSTSTSAWGATATYVRLYKVTTGASSITAYEDHRAGPNGVFSV